jgi:pentalenene oxygenase
LGHALQLRNDPLGFFRSLRDLGDIVEIKLGTQRTFVVTSANLVREMLVVKPREFDKGAQFEEVRAVLGNGLANSDGETHRRHRLMMQPAFRRDRIAEYAKLMHEEIVNATKDWQDGQELDLRKNMTALTLAVTCRALMSSKSADELVGALQDGLPFVLDVMYKRLVNPLAKATAKLPTGTNRQFTETVARLHRMADAIVAEYRGSEEEDRNDLLTMLMLAREDETGAGMTDQEVHDQIMTILVAGTETTATTLSWMFQLLTSHPEVEKRLHAEVDEVLDGRAPEYADVPKLTYTAQVVSETLRFSPPAWMLSRRARNDIELDGYRIPAGAPVMFSPYALHRDPEVYPEPDVFDPDRWSPDRVKQIPRDAIAQFGAGPRKCIGDVFAIVEATLAAATIAGGWRIRPVGEAEVTPFAGMVLWPKDMKLKLEKRNV